MGKVNIQAPLHFADKEDEHKGWIRISEELRGGIESGSYIRVKGNNKTIYCQVRGTPKESGKIKMNEYYRLKLGWQDLQDKVHITVEPANFWDKLRAISSHPDSIVRIGFGLGCISVGLGCISVLYVGLSPSLNLVLTNNFSFTTWGIAGLLVSFIFAVIGIPSIIIGIKSIISK